MKGIFIYNPKIRAEYVRQLYLLKQADNRPMTQLANEAIEQYLLNKQQKKQTKENSNDRRINIY
ncbi:MAG: hypothetical protein ABR980_08765 [Ignavibacteriaceae bacterium]|jgi:hypothetical protein